MGALEEVLSTTGHRGRGRSETDMGEDGGVGLRWKWVRRTSAARGVHTMVHTTGHRGEEGRETSVSRNIHISRGWVAKRQVRGVKESPE